MKSGERKAESGVQRRGRSRSRCALLSAFSSPLSAFAVRRALTLIELLITMAIMAVIAAAILGTASAAMEAGRRDRTRSTITKIHTLVMERWASYENRRVDIKPLVMREIDDLIRTSNAWPTLSQKSKARGQMLADMRLLALRELIKYEMPDRWSDVADNENEISTWLFVSRPPAISQIYFRRFQAAIAAAESEGDAGTDALDRVALHQGAECLYLTVMNATGDGEARTQFTPQDIGDVDGDGAPEFLDGWGNPIAWLRWPAGFTSRSTLMTNPPDADVDHDPFDPFRRNMSSTNNVAGLQPLASNYPPALIPYIQRLRGQTGGPTFSPGFRLVPLIYSSGPDGISDINTSGGASATSTGSNGVYLSPYALETGGLPAEAFVDSDWDNFQYGLPMDDLANPDGDDNSKDNIHNHLIEY